MRLACEIPATGPAAALAARIAAQIPVLETARLRLRAPVTEDFEAFAEILCGPRGIHFGEVSREDAWLDFAQMVAGWPLRGHGAWAVEPKAGGAPLGFVLLGLDQEDPEPELGFLFTTDGEGKGYAFEAAQAARDFAFATLGWTEIASFIAPGNARSLRLAERLGARLDGQIADPNGGEPTLVWRHRRSV